MNNKKVFFILFAVTSSTLLSSCKNMVEPTDDEVRSAVTHEIEGTLYHWETIQKKECVKDEDKKAYKCAVYVEGRVSGAPSSGKITYYLKNIDGKWSAERG